MSGILTGIPGTPSVATTFDGFPWRGTVGQTHLALVFSHHSVGHYVWYC